MENNTADDQYADDIVREYADLTAITDAFAQSIKIIMASASEDQQEVATYLGDKLHDHLMVCSKARAGSLAMATLVRVNQATNGSRNTSGSRAASREPEHSQSQSQSPSPEPQWVTDAQPSMAQPRRQNTHPDVAHKRLSRGKARMIDISR